MTFTKSKQRNRVQNSAAARGDRPPVIILSAARSGTKLMRSLIAATGCYSEVPYDVNYVWRYGNEACSHDALTVDQLTDQTRRFVSTQLRHSAKLPSRSQAFVEKTVSNSLRPEFVKAIFPNAKYVAIVRDGRNVVRSALRCWREPPNAGYLLAKLRSFPWCACAPYAVKYSRSVAGRLFGLSRHVRTWGPRYAGIDEDVANLTLPEVCARQWVASIEHYEQARHQFAPTQLIEIAYESLLSNPLREVSRLYDYLEVDSTAGALDFAVNMVQSPPGRSAQTIATPDTKVDAILRPALERWNYISREKSFTERSVDDFSAASISKPRSTANAAGVQ